MNNKITLSLLGGALLSGAAFAGEVAPPVVETAPCFEGDLYVGAHSDYIFRGALLGRPLIDAGVDLTKSAWGLDFGLGAWYGGFKETATGAEFNVQELDLYAEVSKDFGFARFTTGYIHYNFFGGAGNLATVPGHPDALDINDANEVYFTLSKDFCYGISAAYTYFWNVTDTKNYDNDGYSVGTLAKDDLFVEGLSLTNDLGYYVEKGQLSHNTTSLSYDLAITENATLTPYLAFTWELDYYDNGRGTASYDRVNTYGNGEQNRFHGGVSLSVSF
ncbi:hypothetical protein [Rubritalea tangerina]|uniref:Uncharacterized protein n=1 Tax=Rubritalea tangerina TaxID=430798 RepID=A0ABW4ZDH1_9BACT